MVPDSVNRSGCGGGDGPGEGDGEGAVGLPHANPATTRERTSNLVRTSGGIATRVPERVIEMGRYLAVMPARDMRTRVIRRDAAAELRGSAGTVRETDGPRLRASRRSILGRRAPVLVAAAGAFGIMPLADRVRRTDEQPV